MVHRELDQEVGRVRREVKSGERTVQEGVSQDEGQVRRKNKSGGREGQEGC
jgi:hypothetical protein